MNRFAFVEGDRRSRRKTRNDHSLRTVLAYLSSNHPDKRRSSQRHEKKSPLSPHTCLEHPALFQCLRAFTQPPGLYKCLPDPVTSIRRSKLPSLSSGDKEICLKIELQTFHTIHSCVTDSPQGEK